MAVFLPERSMFFIFQDIDNSSQVIIRPVWLRGIAPRGVWPTSKTSSWASLLAEEAKKVALKFYCTGKSTGGVWPIADLDTGWFWRMQPVTKSFWKLRLPFETSNTQPWTVASTWLRCQNLPQSCRTWRALIWEVVSRFKYIPISQSSFLSKLMVMIESKVKDFSDTNFTSVMRAGNLRVYTCVQILFNGLHFFRILAPGMLV